MLTNFNRPHLKRTARPQARLLKARSGQVDSFAFTLIELILVMALLAIVLAVSAPSLANFFRGRTLDSEARRFLALTHYGQSRAASEGIPMILWIDVNAGTYGLEQDPAYNEGSDAKSITYSIGDDLKLETIRSSLPRQSLPTTINLPMLRFLPDGGLSQQSIPGVVLHHANGEALWIVQSRTALNYEIRDQQSIQASPIR